jgi:hypothetical protein
VPPGLYLQAGACGAYDVNADVTQGHIQVHITFCVDSIRVKEETLNLEFNVYWLAEVLQMPTGAYLSKNSDSGNNKMYVTDQLGGRYDHFITNGAARDGATVGTGHMGQVVRLDGTFVFPPARPGARSFTFHEEDNGFVIANIQLTTPQP